MIYYSTLLSTIDKQNQHDCFDTNNPYLNQGFLQNEKVELISDSDENLEVKFGFESVLLSPKKEDLYITATSLMTDKIYKEKIDDIQSFVDLICDNVYKNQQMPDTVPLIIQIKKRLIEKISNDLIDTKPVLFYDSPINGFGYIMSGEEKVGTFEAVIINRNDTDKSIKLIKFQCIDKLSGINDLKLVFYSNKKFTYEIICKRVVSDDEGTIIVSSFSLIDENVPDEIKCIKDSSCYEDIDEMYIDRRKLIGTVKHDIYDDDDDDLDII